MARWVMTVRPWGFQVVIDMDELRESVELTVDMNWSLEDATLMIKGAVCKSVRCHLFFMQRGKGIAASNLELLSDQQGCTPLISRGFSLCHVLFSQNASDLPQASKLEIKGAPSLGKISTGSDHMPSLLGLTTLATAAPSKKLASEVDLEEERALKRPRGGEAGRH